MFYQLHSKSLKVSEALLCDQQLGPLQVDWWTPWHRTGVSAYLVIVSHTSQPMIREGGRDHKTLTLLKTQTDWFSYVIWAISLTEPQIKLGLQTNPTLSPAHPTPTPPPNVEFYLSIRSASYEPLKTGLRSLPNLRLNLLMFSLVVGSSF